jgi:hypothetical protein
MHRAQFTLGNRIGTGCPSSIAAGLWRNLFDHLLLNLDDGFTLAESGDGCLLSREHHSTSSQSRHIGPNRKYLVVIPYFHSFIWWLINDARFQTLAIGGKKLSRPYLTSHDRALWARILDSVHMKVPSTFNPIPQPVFGMAWQVRIYTSLRTAGPGLLITYYQAFRQHYEPAQAHTVTQ